MEQIEGCRGYQVGSVQTRRVLLDQPTSNEIRIPQKTGEESKWVRENNRKKKGTEHEQEDDSYRLSSGERGKVGIVTV